MRQMMKYYRARKGDLHMVFITLNTTRYQELKRNILADKDKELFQEIHQYSTRYVPKNKGNIRTCGGAT